jgi:hypothetical protein
MSLTVSPASAPYAPPAVAEMENATHGHGEHLQRDGKRRQPHPHVETPAPAESVDLSPASDSPATHGTLIDVRA